MNIPTNDRHADIFVPYAFGNGKIARNRTSLAPMTNRQSNVDCSLGDDELRWLTSRAEGGFGIVITCAAHISRQGQGWANELGIFDDHLLPGLRQLAASVQGAGALAIVQINHAGSRAPSAVTGTQPVSASTFTLDIPGFEVPREITTVEIKTVIADFGTATRRAFDAGFDGVELHGANGYLLTQFISTATNLRTDQYGGSLANRARLVVECLDACRATVPADFLVGVRLSPDGSGLSEPETAQIARLLVDHGADFIDLSSAGGLPSIREAIPECPIIAGGGVWTAADARRLRANGADFVFLGSAAIGNPDWPTRAATPGYEAVRKPYSVDHLHKCGITDNFIAYMQTLPFGLVDTN